MDVVIDWSREALRMSLLLGGPVLLAALTVGIIVGIGQVLTQMQDPIVGMVPRLVVVSIVVLVILPWMIATWTGYTHDLIQTLPERLFG